MESDEAAAVASSDYSDPALAQRLGLTRWIRRLPDLTRDGRFCPAKALLEDLCPEGEEGRFVYAEYFERFLFVDETICMPSLASAVEKKCAKDSRRSKILDDLFKLNKPAEEPAFFSFSSRKDLARLSEIAGQEFVVYFFDVSRQELVPFYDPRGACYKLKTRYRDCYLWTSDGRLLSTGARGLSAAPRFALDNFYLTQSSGLHLVARQTGLFAPSLSPRGWLEAVEKALLGEEGAAALPALDDVDDDDDLSRISGPGFFQGKRLALWNRWQKPAIVCAFVGLEKAPPRGSSHLRRALSSRTSLTAFQTLAHVRAREDTAQSSLTTNPDTPVVCVISGCRVARLAEPFAEAVRQRASGLSDEKDRLSNSGLNACWGDPIKKPNPADREAAFRALKAKRQSARSARLDATEKRCRCKTACGREDFDDNMSRAGPERLMSGRYCARDLVKMLGASHLLVSPPGSECADVLEEACNLCIASMDLESRTIAVSTSQDRSAASDDCSAPADGFFGPRKTLDTRFVQKPLMLAHVDGLTCPLPPTDPSRCFLTVPDDSESAIFDMFASYWDYVLHSQKRAAFAKAVLLKPLFDLVESYKTAYFDFCSRWRVEDEERRRDAAAQVQKSYRTKKPKRKRLRVLSPTPSDLAEQNQLDLEAPLASFLQNSGDNDDGSDDDDDDDDNSEEEEEAEEAEEEEEDNAYDDDDDDDDGDCDGDDAKLNDIMREAGLRVVHDEWPEFYGGRRQRQQQQQQQPASMIDLNLRAWTETLPGKLEAKLLQIVRSYQIFSFYGSGYDHVLLLCYLVPRLFELGFRPRVERRGNRVTTVSTRSGVCFRDVTKLLAPSMNLRRFGQLFGFEQEKAHFPFSLLASVEDLSRPGLPASADDPGWSSNLGYGKITQREVSEALALFESAGCSSLGDYLLAYLRLDVEILLKATVAWKSTLLQLVGVDFVDAARFTISSLSYDAGLREWERRLRLGCFFPNNSQHYRLLRMGMRGGLCSVYRTVAGGQGDGARPWFFAPDEKNRRDPAEPGDGEVDDNDAVDEDFSSAYSNNAHWLPQEGSSRGGPSRFVGYYDAASLYPSSGELSCTHTHNIFSVLLASCLCDARREVLASTSRDPPRRGGPFFVSLARKKDARDWRRAPSSIRRLF